MSAQPYLNRLAELAWLYGSRLIKAAGILIIGLAVATLAQKVIIRMLRNTASEVQLFFGRLTYVVAIIGAVLWALSSVKVNIAALVTLMGAVSLAISLSLQDVARNFVAGLYLLIERPFRVGDHVSVRTFNGRVELIGLRTTTLRTDEDQQVIVPNTVIMSEVVLRRMGERARDSQRD